MPVKPHSFAVVIASALAIVAGLAGLSPAASATAGPRPEASGRPGAAGIKPIGQRRAPAAPVNAAAGHGLPGPGVAGIKPIGQRRPPAAPVNAVARDGRHPIKVGSVVIPPCSASKLAWCTTINVPYDYFNKAAGTIKLGFQWYPATGGKSHRTIVAIQGGPGYATTDYAFSYRAMLFPLLRTRNLLLVDLRGTGASSPFLCKALQHWTLLDSIASYTADTGACGRQLNHTRKLRGGRGYVHGSDLYTTANAARDVALLLRKLHTGKVDYYGDSYATFFGQVFTARFHRLLRSVTLDAAYPVVEANPFYPLALPAAHRGFNRACDRSVTCREATQGRSWSRIGAAAVYLRKHPVTGKIRDPYGDMTTTRVGINELIELVNIAGSDNGVYRELDPAIRALLGPDHDAVPLLRLTAQEIFPSEDSGPVRNFNAGSYEATTCLDYPQPFSYSSSIPQRHVEYRQAVARLGRHAFGPFTAHEWVTEPLEEFDACLSWPAPVHPDPPITTRAPYAPRSLPVLVLSGDLDSLTTPAEGRWTAREMGPSARWILIRNDTHVNAMDDTFGCAAGLVRQFMADPRRLRQLDASCARHTPEVRTLGNFPMRLGEVRPASPAAGNQAGLTALRLAAVAAAVVGDADWRWYYGDGVHGWGLRGGTFSFAGPEKRTVITFRGDRWTRATAVSGHAIWNIRSGRLTAWLTVTAPDGRTATLRLRYRDYVAHAIATLAGTYAGRHIAATMPAP